MQERSQHGVIRSDIHLLDVSGLNVVLVNQAQHFSHRGVRQRTGRMRLDRDARRSERPGFSEPAHDGIRIESAAFGLKESEGRFQNINGSGPPERRQIGCHRPVFRGMPRLKRFGHGTEIVAESAAFGGPDSEGINCLLDIEPAKPGACRGAAECAARSGGMETLIEKGGGMAFSILVLTSTPRGDSRHHEILAGTAPQFAKGKRRRKHTDGRMRQQSIDAVFGGGELRVVIIVGVDGHSVHESRKARMGFHTGADHARPHLARAE